MTTFNSLEILRSIYPDRVALSPEEVTSALYGRQDRAAVQAVRAMLLRGRLVPFLTKIGGRWIIPMAALAQALEDLQVVPLGRPHLRRHIAQARKRSGWRAKVGERPANPTAGAHRG